MKNSKIEWTHHTFNPWWGCVKVSEACAHCYAERDAKRYGHDVWGPDKPRRFQSDKYWEAPLQWDRDAAQAGEKHRVFCASMADVFEDYQGPNANKLFWERRTLWELIEVTPSLIWLLLTKRPENIIRMVPNDWRRNWPKNVWPGTTTEDQPNANKRIPELLKVPARVRFLSCEPVLGPVNLAMAYPDGFAVCSNQNCGHFGMWDSIRQCVNCDSREENPDNGDCAKCNKGTMTDICPKCEASECYEHPSVYCAEEYERLAGIHWVICGGESGPGARPMHPDWARSLRDQCEAASVPFFFKQWGDFAPWKFGTPWTVLECVHPDGRVGADCSIPPCETESEFNAALAGRAAMQRLGKARAGRLLDGREWNEIPS